mgnify:CR=1 FL=1
MTRSAPKDLFNPGRRDALARTAAIGSAAAAAQAMPLAAIAQGVKIEAKGSTGVSIDGGTNPALWTNSAVVGSFTDVASTNLSYTCTSLTTGRRYYIRIAASNVTGTGAFTASKYTTVL